METEFRCKIIALIGHLGRLLYIHVMRISLARVCTFHRERGVVTDILPLTRKWYAIIQYRRMIAKRTRVRVHIVCRLERVWTARGRTKVDLAPVSKSHCTRRLILVSMPAVPISLLSFSS